MKMSQHAHIRQQQRCIPQMIIDLIIGYGATESAGSGVTKHYFDKHARRRLKAYAGSVASLLDEHLNCYVVTGDDGTVITVAHRIDRIKH